MGFKMTIEIDNVSLEEHALEARLNLTGSLIDSEKIDVIEYTDYSWTVDDPPDIKVINQYDSPLKVFMTESTSSTWPRRRAVGSSTWPTASGS